MLVRWLVLVLCLLLIGSLGMFFTGHHSSSLPAWPNPNGYDALLGASAKLRGKVPDIDSKEYDELAEFIATNREALGEVKQALALPSVVTVQTSESWTSAHSPELLRLKAAAKALDAQATLLAWHGDTNAALEVALGALRFSDSMQQGGVLIDYLVGSACELIAVRRMTNLLAGLDQSHCKQALLKLEEMDSQRDSFADLMQREDEWSRTTFGPLKRVQMMIETRSLRPGKELEAMFPNPAEEYRGRVTETRAAIVLFAARTYELEHGAKPSSIRDLVPAYLRIAPTNLVSGVPLTLP